MYNFIDGSFHSTTLVTSLASRGHRVTWVTSLRQPEPGPGVSQVTVDTPTFTALFRDTAVNETS